MGITERGELILLVTGLVIVFLIFFAGVTVGYLFAKKSGKKMPRG